MNKTAIKSNFFMFFIVFKFILFDYKISEKYKTVQLFNRNLTQFQKC